MGYMRCIGVQKFTRVIQEYRGTGVGLVYSGSIGVQGLCSAPGIMQGCTRSTEVHGYWSSTGVHGYRCSTVVQ